MGKVRKILLVFGLILISFYLAIAGWLGSDALIAITPDSGQGDNQPIVYDGLTFANSEAAKEYMKEKAVGSWIPWMWDQPISPLFIASVGFGLLGGTIRLIKKSFSSHPPKLLSLFLVWLFSGAIGMILFFLLNFFLNTKTNGLYAFILLPLLGGLFSEETYNWLEKRLIGIFEAIFK